MNKSRQHDFEQLMEERKNAKNAFERDLVDRTVDRIARETKETESDRQDLIGAIRNGDRRAVNYYQERLRKRSLQIYGE